MSCVFIQNVQTCIRFYPQFYGEIFRNIKNIVILYNSTIGVQNSTTNRP